MGHPSARRVRVSGAIITEVTCRHTKPRERRPRRPRRSTPVSRRARDRGTGFLNRIRWTESATRSAFRATRGHARAIHGLVARRATATAFFLPPRNPRRVASTSRGSPSTPARSRAWTKTRTRATPFRTRTCGLSPRSGSAQTAFQIKKRLRRSAARRVAIWATNGVTCGRGPRIRARVS